MKQREDNKTGDLLAGAVRQRGRPSTGHALTGAERQAAYRERLRASKRLPVTIYLEDDVVTALKNYVEFKDMDYSEAVQRIMRDRLLRKR